MKVSSSESLSFHVTSVRINRSKERYGLVYCFKSGQPCCVVPLVGRGGVYVPSSFSSGACDYGRICVVTSCPFNKASNEMFMRYYGRPLEDVKSFLKRLADEASRNDKAMRRRESIVEKMINDYLPFVSFILLILSMAVATVGILFISNLFLFTISATLLGVSFVLYAVSELASEDPDPRIFHAIFFFIIIYLFIIRVIFF